MLASLLPSDGALRLARIRGPGTAARARSRRALHPEFSASRRDRDLDDGSARWLDLLSPAADRDQALEFFDAMVPQGITRVVVKERDRAALQGTLPGEGYRLVVEVFMETGARGRIATWRLDIRRPRGDDLGRQPWRILSRGSARVDRGPASTGAAAGETVRGEEPGAARGRFRAAPAGGRGVRRGDAGRRHGDGAARRRHDGVSADAEGRTRPAEVVRRHRIARDAVHLRVRAPQSVRDSSSASPATCCNRWRSTARAYRRGLSVFEDSVPKSFNLDLSDLSREVWSLLPQPGDFVAEVKTRRFDDLTYARSSGEAEDVTMFQRGRKRNICAYASEQKLAEPRTLLRRGRQRRLRRPRLRRRCVVLSGARVDGRPDADEDPRQRRNGIGVLTLRFADSLNVSSVTSDEFGRLLFLRVRNQNSVLVNLPSPVARDFPMTLTVNYSGRLTRQNILDESVTFGSADGQRNAQPDDIPTVAAGTEVAVQQSQLLVSAEPGDRLRHRAHSPDRADGLPRGRVRHPRSRVAGRRARRRRSKARRESIPRTSYSFVAPQPVRYLGVADQPDDARRRRDGRARHRPGQGAGAGHARRRHAAAADHALQCRDRDSAGRRAQHGAADRRGQPPPGIARPARRSAPRRRSCVSMRA